MTKCMKKQTIAENKKSEITNLRIIYIQVKVTPSNKWHDSKAVYKDMIWLVWSKPNRCHKNAEYELHLT